MVLIRVGLKKNLKIPTPLLCNPVISPLLRLQPLYGKEG